MIAKGGEDPPSPPVSPGIFLIYYMVVFFSLLSAYFSVIEHKRVHHRDVRRAEQRRRHIPNTEDVLYDYEVITKELALFRILAENYKLSVEEDILPWWELVKAQSTEAMSSHMTSEDVRRVLEMKKNWCHDHGGDEEEYEKTNHMQRHSIAHKVKKKFFYGEEIGGDSDEWQWEEHGGHHETLSGALELTVENTEES